MRQSLYLAFRYLLFHNVRSLVLICSLAIVIFLPNGVGRLIHESEESLMARARSTPMIIGAKGSSTDLVLNALYFQREHIEQITLKTAHTLNETGLGYAIPVFTRFTARGFPIVGTTLDYFKFRNLQLQHGRNIVYMGECILGSRVAERLNLKPGDSIISTPENYFDLAGVFPVKMKVVGVFQKNNASDDNAVFTDLKTTWTIAGLGHGHEDLGQTRDPSVILQRGQQQVTANAKLYLYNEITPGNVDRFHFHGDSKTYPITATIFIPNDQKSLTILHGRFAAGELSDQVVLPGIVVQNLLERIFRIKNVFNTVFLLVGFATLLIMGLILTLNVRLRRDELHTMYTIGSSRKKVTEILSFELGIIVLTSLILALVFYVITGFFIEMFIASYIL